MNTSGWKRTALALATLGMLGLGAGQARAADPVCGDVNQSGSVTSGDALLVLKNSVGQPATLKCPVPAAALQTGQTTCYDDTGKTIACAGTDQDGEAQRGIARAFTDNGDGTITDLKTGLMWEKLSSDDGVHNATNTYTWLEAFTGKIATLNNEVFAGHEDWRVPNLFELQSLLNLGTSSPPLYSIFTQGCVAGCTVLQCSCTFTSAFWSSTAFVVDATSAWRVYFWLGDTAWTPKTSKLAVRAVRGGA